MSDRLDSIERKIDGLTTALQGDPADANKPGLVTRLDRLEQDRDRLRGWTQLIGGAAVTALIGMVVKWVKG